MILYLVHKNKFTNKLAMIILLRLKFIELTGIRVRHQSVKILFTKNLTVLRKKTSGQDGLSYIHLLGPHHSKGN